MFRLVLFILFIIAITAAIIFAVFFGNRNVYAPSGMDTSSSTPVISTSSEALLDDEETFPPVIAPPVVALTTSSFATTTGNMDGGVSAVIFSDAFQYSDGLITNEYAEANPEDRRSINNPLWLVTSGSLFGRNGAGYTGKPDGKTPDLFSCGGNCTGSAIFRMVTKRRDFKDVSVSFDFVNYGLVSTAKTPEMAWDGVHVFLRYQSFDHLYVLTINRRDGTVNIKKKLPDGGHGEYLVLSEYPAYPVTYGQKQMVKALARTNSDGSVTIELYGNNRLLVSARDDGSYGAPITLPGRVGIRTDNAEVTFDNFVVRGL